MPEEFVEYVFKLEGGYVNDNSDLGGETRYGIASNFNPDVDVKNLTRFEAYAIYEDRYYKQSYAPIWYEAGYKGIAFLCFDCKVSGQIAVLKEMQEILMLGSYHNLKIDGVPGKATLLAFKDSCWNEEELLNLLSLSTSEIASKMAAVTMEKQKKAGKPVKDYTLGWTRRCNMRLGYCKRFIHETV